MTTPPRFIHALDSAEQERLKGYLRAQYDDLHQQTKGFGHEARQYLITINLAGVAGALTYIAALHTPKEIAGAWGALAFFSVGVIFIGCVLAINALSFRVHHNESVGVYEDMLRGQHGGISVDAFWEVYYESQVKLRRWSALADLCAYGAWGWAILGLISLSLTVFRNATN